MKKSLIALAVLSAAGVAQAQSSLTIYGSVDVSYVKQSGNLVSMSGGAERSDYFMGTASDNTYLGFMGVEDLGGGLKATFQLEQRFNLANGAASLSGLFEGAANVGLSGNFGQVRFGRVNELSTETYRRIDPFDQSGVAGALQTPYRGDDGGGRLSSTARYDSPDIKGFNLGASYTLKNNGTDPASQTNTGYAVSGTYTNGPLYLVANYNKAVNSGDAYNWNIGGAYTFGQLKLSLGYEDSLLSSIDDSKVSTFIVGASYACGNGVFNASYSHMEEDYPLFGYTDNKYAVGYTHNLSKRTSTYANYAHIKDTTWGGLPSPGYSLNLAEIGITHKF